MYTLKNELQEIQGLYGAFSLSERSVQKIWLKGQFDQTELKTASGKNLRIVDPGRWNLLEGPDFREARLELDGRPVVGDVEVHFNTADWHLHGHGHNPNFENVCLHVVLYPEDRSALPVMTSRGACPDLLYLLPRLDRDLEDFAVEDALLEIEQVEELEWMRRFLEHDHEERRSILRSGADRRWAAKVKFAKSRLAGASWSELCHQYCLEVLGYARNRAPMAQIALNHSLDAFASKVVDTEALFQEERSRWRLSGLRPANHPRKRLEQYHRICRARPNWPNHLISVLRELPEFPPELTTASFRRKARLSQLAEQIGQEVFSGELSDKRLNTLVCDALLPLAAAAELSRPAALRQHWQHWPAGDVPQRLQAFLKRTEVFSRAEPCSNGAIQGGLALLL